MENSNFMLLSVCSPDYIRKRRKNDIKKNTVLKLGFNNRNSEPINVDNINNIKLENMEDSPNLKISRCRVGLRTKFT